MKKKLLSMLAMCLTAGLLAGCGESADTPLKDMEVEKYVTLGDYKGLDVSVEAPAVKEAELETLMATVYQNHITAENGIKDRAVAVGDTANIDYEGKKDGVAFEGGTAAGYNLGIGSGSFIDGFEEGLVGVMPGETVDLNLTFPANYGNELAGQAVVFTVTVNYIIPTEYDNAVIAGMGLEGVSNEEELRQYCHDYLYDMAEQNYTVAVQNAVLESFMAGNAIENVPEFMVAKYEAVMRENIEREAAAYGVDADTLTNVYYGMNFEDFLNEYCGKAAEQDLALQAVANKENLNITDEELDETLLSYAQQAGYSSIEDYIGEASKEDYREYFLYEKVLNYLVENAIVNASDAVTE